MLYFVYEEVDPRTDIPFYVGITKNPNQRHSQHLDGKDTANKEKSERVKQLQAEGVTPKMRVLETIYDGLQCAREREKHWIQTYCSQGYQLVNIRLIKLPKPKQQRIPKPKPRPKAKRAPAPQKEAIPAPPPSDQPESIIWAWVPKSRFTLKNEEDMKAIPCPSWGVTDEEAAAYLDMPIETIKMRKERLLPAPSLVYISKSTLYELKERWEAWKKKNAS